MVDRVLDSCGPSELVSSKTGVTVLDHSQHTLLVRCTLRRGRVCCILRNDAELKELGELVVSPHTSTRRIVPVALS